MRLAQGVARRRGGAAGSAGRRRARRRGRARLRPSASARRARRSSWKSCSVSTMRAAGRCARTKRHHLGADAVEAVQVDDVGARLGEDAGQRAVHAVPSSAGHREGVVGAGAEQQVVAVPLERPRRGVGLAERGRRGEQRRRHAAPGEGAGQVVRDPLRAAAGEGGVVVRRSGGSGVTSSPFSAAATAIRSTARSRGDRRPRSRRRATARPLATERREPRRRGEVCGRRRAGAAAPRRGAPLPRR